MPKLFRRSWERYQQGRAGAISSVLSARTGSDGAIASGTFSAPVQVMTSATASFVSTDVGRKIRLTGTPQSGRYDGMYVIDAVNSGTSVNLRHNHNVGSTPASPARFFENGGSINWKICESCTFTADAAGDIEDFYPGSFIIIEGATNANGNNGIWLISHRTSNQVCTLSKSHTFFRNDFTGGLGFFAKDDQFDFVAESGLRWSVTDREPHNSPDAWELQVQALIDSGWTMYHQRGSNATMLTVGDCVLRSLGETDSAIPGGKSMFLRCIMAGVGRSAQAQYSTGMVFMWALYQHWDPTQTSAPTSAPGDGAAHCQFGTAAANAASRTAGTVHSSGPEWPLADGTVDYATIGRNGLPADTRRRDFCFFGDRDEVYMNLLPSGSTIAGFHMNVSHLKPIGSNPNIVTVTAAVAAGANKDVNVGTIDVAALTPPYAVGDNITIMGRKTAATREFIETTTIVSFNNADVNNRLVRVTNLAQGYGNGPDTLKAQIGEDPFPVVTQAASGSTFTPKLHNLARLADATGRDWDNTNKGSTGNNVTALASFNEVDPDRRTGKFGLSPVHMKSTANGEYRGRFRYYWLADNGALPLGKKIVALNTDVYVLVHGNQGSNSSAVFIGPMSKAMAGIR